MSDVLSSAIADLVDSQLVTKWLVIVEAYDSEGNRYLAPLGSDDLATWDALGMLRWYDAYLSKTVDTDE